LSVDLHHPLDLGPRKVVLHVNLIIQLIKPVPFIQI
jgi:hypothetical protein